MTSVPGIARSSSVDSARGSGEQVQSIEPAIREAKNAAQLHELPPCPLAEKKCILRLELVCFWQLVILFPAPM